MSGKWEWDPDRNEQLRIIKCSSIRLPDGGDTHFHPYPGGLNVTTRLPGNIPPIHTPIEPSMFPHS